MFKKLFGGGEKKPEPKKQEKKEVISKDVEAEKIIFSLDQQIQKMNDQSNKLENEADLLTQKSKELIAQKKTKEAKQAVAQLNDIKKKIELLNTRKKVLRTQKTQLQVARMDIDMTSQMQAANTFMKQLQSVNEKMNDIVLDANQIKSNMEQTNRLMKQLAGGEEQDQETDDLFKQLENEVNTKQAEHVAQNLNTNATVTVKPVKAQTNKATVQDDLAQWLN